MARELVIPMNNKVLGVKGQLRECYGDNFYLPKGIKSQVKND